MRMPAEYRWLECTCEKTGPDDPMILTYSRERGFFEPLTNRAAEPVVGKVLSWKYYQRLCEHKYRYDHFRAGMLCDKCDHFVSDFA